MMDKKERAMILCTVDDARDSVDVSIGIDGTKEYLLIAFSVIAKELSEMGISPLLLLRVVMAKDVLYGKTDKDGGAE